MARSVDGRTLVVVAALATQACFASMPQAAHDGDVLLVNSYLLGRPPDTRFDDGGCPRCTLLHHAAGAGQVEVVRTLLAQGADPNATDGIEATPLHHACHARSAEVAKLLLASGAHRSLTARDAWGNTPLLVAAAGGTRRRDLPVFARFATVLTAVDADGPASAELIAVLIDAGADMALPNVRGNTPLHVAAYRGHANAVAVLLARGADSRARNADGQTAADVARGYRRAEVLTMLAAGPLLYPVLAPQRAAATVDARTSSRP